MLNKLNTLIDQNAKLKNENSQLKKRMIALQTTKVIIINIIIIVT